MQACCYCHKEVDAKAKICPHCGEKYPTGRPFYSHPVVIVAWLVFSAEGFWLLHSFTELPGWLSILLAPSVVALLFLLLWTIGD